MTEIIYRTSRSRRVDLPDGVPIHAGAPKTRASRARPRTLGAPCAFGVPEQNSRAGGECPSGALRSSHAFEPELHPSLLLASSDRVYALGRLRWDLHDLGGARVATGQRAAGSTWLDPSVFLQLDPMGLLRMRQPSDGVERAWLSLFMGNNFGRHFVAVHGERLVVGGFENVESAEHEHVPELSSIELWSLEEPLNQAPTGQLRPGLEQPLLFNTAKLLTASYDGGIVAAYEGRIVRIDWELEVTSLLTGSFTPIALSLDEAGWTYLIVDEPAAEGSPAPTPTPAPARCLWIVAPSGERTVRVPLPAPLATKARTPPIVGHDHRVIIVGGGALLALDARGELLFARRTSDACPGAIITADDQLLVSDGADLVVIDPAGQRAVLRHFDDGALVTAPVMDPSGDVLVATNETLHRLAHA